MVPILFSKTRQVAYCTAYQVFFWAPPSDTVVRLDAEARLTDEFQQFRLLPYQGAADDSCHLAAIVRLLQQNSLG